MGDANMWVRREQKRITITIHRKDPSLSGALRVIPVKKHQFLSLFQHTLLLCIRNYSKMATNFSYDLYSYWFGMTFGCFLKKKKKKISEINCQVRTLASFPIKIKHILYLIYVSVYYWRNTVWICSKSKCSLLAAMLKAALTSHNDWCSSSQPRRP